jgi:hypothetical protein
MRGPDGVRGAIAALLADVLPVKIPLLREAYGVDQGVLPDLDVVSSGEMAENALTSVGQTWLEVVNPRLLPGIQRVDIDPAGYPVYRMRYACRVYVWALGKDWANAIARRDMMTGATRMALFEWPTLTMAGGDTGYLVHEDTWTEEYGVPSRAPNDSGRCWASALISVDAWSEETMTAGRMHPPLGEVAVSPTLGTTIFGQGEPMPTDLPRPDGFPLPDPDPEESDDVDP